MLADVLYRRIRSLNGSWGDLKAGIVLEGPEEGLRLEAVFYSSNGFRSEPDTFAVEFYRGEDRVASYVGVLGSDIKRQSGTVDLEDLAGFMSRFEDDRRYRV